MDNADASLGETARLPTALRNGSIGSMETVMHTRKFERLALTTFFLAVCVAFFGACVAIVRAQGTNPAHSAPPLLDAGLSSPPPVFSP
jgi:hypothetical protein